MFLPYKFLKDVNQMQIRDFFLFLLVVCGLYFAGVVFRFQGCGLFCPFALLVLVSLLLVFSPTYAPLLLLYNYNKISAFVKGYLLDLREIGVLWIIF